MSKNEQDNNGMKYNSRQRLFEQHVKNVRFVRSMRIVCIVLCLAVFGLLVSSEANPYCTTNAKYGLYFLLLLLLLGYLFFQAAVLGVAGRDPFDPGPYFENFPDTHTRRDYAYFDARLTHRENIAAFIMLGILGSFIPISVFGIRDKNVGIQCGILLCGLLLSWKLFGRYAKISFYQDGVFFQTYAAAKWGFGREKFVQYKAFSHRTRPFLGAEDFFENDRWFWRMPGEHISARLLLEILARLPSSRHEFVVRVKRKKGRKELANSCENDDAAPVAGTDSSKVTNERT